MASSWLLLLGSTGENDKNYYSAATITNEPSQQINPASSAYRMKYLNTDAKILLSDPVKLVAPAPMAIFCGHTILPIPAPITFAAVIQYGLSCKAVAVSNCKLPNSTQVDVPEPVIKAPNTPISGATKG